MLTGILFLLLQQQPDKPVWAQSSIPPTVQLLAPEGATCRTYFAALWRNWIDPKDERIGYLRDGPTNWWNETGRRKYTSLCPTRDLAKADYIYLWSTRSGKESVTEMEQKAVISSGVPWSSDITVKSPVQKEREYEEFYIELKCARSGNPIKAAQQRSTEPATFVFSDAVVMMADAKVPCR